MFYPDLFVYCRLLCLFFSFLYLDKEDWNVLAWDLMYRTLLGVTGTCIADPYSLTDVIEWVAHMAGWSRLY